MKALAALFSTIVLSASSHLAHAQGTIAGIDTNGRVLIVNQKTGVIVEKAEEVLEDYSLGATARLGDRLYYVATPNDGSENAIYTANLRSGSLSHVDLDRDGDVRDLFFQGGKLYGVFYGSDGVGVYRINPSSGVTRSVLNFDSLNVEPIAGAFTKLRDDYYLLVRPESDRDRRQLMKFKLDRRAPTLAEVRDANGNTILCDKIKAVSATRSFICLASDSEETQLSVVRLSTRGRATVLSNIAGIVRAGGGHTLLTHDGKDFYAFVYAVNQYNNQHIIKFNAKGTLKANVEIDTIFIGGHFRSTNSN